MGSLGRGRFSIREVVLPGTIVEVIRRHEKVDVAFVKVWFEVLGAYPLAVGPTIRLRTQGTLRSWLRRFGYQDVMVGDRTFDERYIVKANDEDKARTVLAPVVDALAANHEWVADLRSDAEGVRLRTRRLTIAIPSGSVWGALSAGAESWIEEGVAEVPLNVLTDAVATMVTADLFGVDALQRVEGAEMHWPSRGAPEVRLEVPEIIRFTVEVQDGQACLVARGPCASHRRLREELIDATGSSAALRALGAAPAPFLCGGRVSLGGETAQLTWPGLCHDPKVIARAAAWLAALGRPELGGAYR